MEIELNRNEIKVSLERYELKECQVNSLNISFTVETIGSFEDR